MNLINRIGRLMLPEFGLAFLLAWIALLLTLIYSFTHLIWYFARLESGAGFFAVVGAMALELTIISCEFGLLRKRLRRRDRTFLWSALLFFMLFSFFANAYHATAANYGIKSLTFSHVSRMDWLDLVAIPLSGGLPPVITLILSVLLPILAPSAPVRSRAVRKPIKALPPVKKKKLNTNKASS